MMAAMDIHGPTFDELASRHYRAAFRTARAIVGSRVDAEDTVQDALVHAYVRLSSFRGDSTFGTWLIAITRNRAIDRLRRHRRYARTFSPCPDPVAFASRERSPEDVLLDGERRRHLAQCIEALPARLRDALRLASTGRHSYEEMGTILGAPTGTIKSRVSEARRIVARSLRNRDGQSLGVDNIDNYEGHRR
jgi:RNA polymerase sigma-70 factor (ECF subfamily)